MLSGVTAPWRGVRAAADRHVAQPSRVEQLRHSSASYRRIVTWPSSPAARCSYSSRTRRARHGAPARRLEEEAQQAQLPAQRVVALLAAAELEGLRGVGNICGLWGTHAHPSMRRVVRERCARRMAGVCRRRCERGEALEFFPCRKWLTAVCVGQNDDATSRRS